MLRLAAALLSEPLTTVGPPGDSVPSWLTELWLPLRRVVPVFSATRLPARSYWKVLSLMTAWLSLFLVVAAVS